MERLLFIVLFIFCFYHHSMAEICVNDQQSGLVFKPFRMVLHNTEAGDEIENELYFPHLAPENTENAIVGVYNDSLQNLSLFFEDSNTLNISILRNMNIVKDTLLQVSENDSCYFDFSSYGEGDFIILAEPQDSAKVLFAQFSILGRTARELRDDFYWNRDIEQQTSSNASTPFSFDAKIRMRTEATFCDTFNYVEGTNQQITVRSNTQCFVYLFAVNHLNECSYSYTTDIINDTLYNKTILFNVPYTDSYCILVTTTSDVKGKECVVTVNNYYNKTSPVAYNLFAYSNEGNFDYPYNIFSTSRRSDPMLFVLDNTNRIVAFNDNYNSNGDYDWGLTARVVLPGSQVVGGVIVNSTPTYGVTENGRIDVYAGCPSIHDGTNLKTYYQDYFSSFDDMMVSAPASLEYDHITWAIGEYNYDDPYLTLFQFNALDPEKPLSPIDMLFRKKLYTREYVTEANSDIDLYVTVEDSICLYAAVAAFGNKNSTGYAWESKVGTSERVFHPRYAIRDYAEDGEEVSILHYRHLSIFELQDLDEIDDFYVDYVYRNFELTEAEDSTLRQGVRGLSRRKINQFQNAYDQCKQILLNENKKGSLCLNNNPAYINLLSLCQQTPAFMNYAYLNANNGDRLAFKLINDVSVPQHPNIVNWVKEYNDSLKENSNKQKIRYTVQANTILFVKALLAEYTLNSPMFLSPKGASDSNDSGIFKASVKGQSIEIAVNTSSDDVVTINVASSTGRSIHTGVYQRLLNKGKHCFNIPVDRAGIYTITYYVNGRVYNKKLIVK